MNRNDNLSCAEWERIESAEHDRLYKDSLPFDSTDYKIDPPHVLWWQDYCYKKGRRPVRGHRTKLAFELMNIHGLGGKTLLDIGCGNGQYSVLFALMGASVRGIDITTVGIEVASRIAAANGVADRCLFSVQSAAHLNFEDNAFDIVVLHEALHHAIKYPGVKAEVLRVLKKGGIAVCTEVLDGNLCFRLARSFTMRGKEAKGDVVMTLSELRDFASGFASYHLELMSLLFMCKRVLRNQIRYAPVRWFLYLAKKADDILLGAIPPLRKYCGEAVLVARK